MISCVAPGLPPPVVDKTLSADTCDLVYNLDGESHPLNVTGTPAARNGVANPNYDGGKGYEPVGSVSDRAIGHRCMGNTSCVPICPVQAKYNAMKLLVSIRSASVVLATQCVASKLEIAPDSGRITGVEVKHYFEKGSAAHEILTARGRIVVL